MNEERAFLLRQLFEVERETADQCQDQYAKTGKRTWLEAADHSNRMKQLINKEYSRETRN